MTAMMDCNKISAPALAASGITIGPLFEATVRRTPNASALVCGSRVLTYLDLHQHTNRLCHYLIGLNVHPGDRIAILSENNIEYVALLVACAKLGCILACQNWRLTDLELRHCLTLVEPRILFTSERYSEFARKQGYPFKTITLNSNYEATLARLPAEDVELCADPEAGLVILYTSGTTGLPKGALISQRAEIARTLVQLTDLPTDTEDRFVAWAPLFHMVSTDTVFMKLIQGGATIITDGFDAQQLAGIVAEEYLGRLTLMPGMIGPFLDAVAQNGNMVKSVKYAGVMADLVPRAQIAEVTTLLKAPYLNSFGSTETGSPPASHDKIEIGVQPAKLNKKQSPFCWIRLVDSNGDDVPVGTPGEVLMRGPTLFSGYWNNPEATAEAFKDGWFHMGDVFVQHGDGTYSFVDRKKYLIKSGGENIYPAEIERILLSMPKVADAVVVRCPDEKWGEVPVAFVAKRDQTLTAKDLLKQCQKQIAKYKMPKSIIFINESEIPRSTTGKIKRSVLEQQLIEAHER